MRYVVNGIVSIAVLSSCAYAFIALGTRPEPDRKPLPRAEGILIQVGVVKKHDGPMTLTANGTVVPHREIRLATEIKGKVVERSPNLRSGRTVRRDEILVKLDQIDYQLEVRRLKQQQEQDAAEIDAIDVQLNNTQRLVELARQERQLQQKERKRIERLKENNAGSESDVDAAIRAELMAENALVRLQNTIGELQSQRILLEKKKDVTSVLLERAELDQSRTVIKSPIDGVIVETSVEEQNYLQPGIPFVVIEDLSSMDVDCSLTLDDMYWIWNSARDGQAQSMDRLALPPTPVTVRFEIGSQVYAWKGILSRQSQAGLDEQSRTIPCRVRVDEPHLVRMVGMASEDFASNDGPPTLMRGMFVGVDIVCTPHRDLLEIPVNAIRPGNRVWIAEENKLWQKQIKVVTRSEESVIVDAIDEVSVGDSLITSPVANVRDGLLIRTGKSRDKPGSRGKDGPNRNQGKSSNPREQRR